MNAPNRASTLPIDAKARKTFPVASGFMDYFPDAIVAISNLSYRGNEQHNPGKPLHWDRTKSTDESDTMLRHFLQRGTVDTDGVPHTVKMAWRALAVLQKEIEAEGKEERDCEAIARWKDLRENPFKEWDALDGVGEDEDLESEPPIVATQTGPTVAQGDGDDGGSPFANYEECKDWVRLLGCVCRRCAFKYDYEQGLISSTPVQVLNRADRPVDNL